MAPPQSMLTKKSVVSFQESVHVRTTLPIHEYTAAEMHACWMTPQESLRAQREIQNDISRLECGLHVLDGCCTRGLEHKTREGGQARRRRKLSVVNAVLDEQELQRCESGGNVNVYDLAVVSRAVSQQSVADALMMGYLDQREAFAAQSDVVPAKKAPQSSRPRSTSSSILRSPRMVLRQLIGKAA